MFDPQQHPYAQTPGGAVSSEDKTWAVIAHLAPLIGYIAVIGQIIIPLIILLTRGKDSPFVREHAKEALNFQISMAIYFFVAAILTLVLIGIFLAIALGIFTIVAMVMAATRAGNGEDFRYPYIIRFVP